MNAIEQIKNASKAYITILKTQKKAGYNCNAGYYCTIYTQKENGILNTVWDVYNECNLKYAEISKKEKYIFPGFYFPAYYFKVKKLYDLNKMLKEINPNITIRLLVGGSVSPVPDIY